MPYIYATAIFSRGVVGDLGGVGNGQRVRDGIAPEKYTAALSRFVVGNFRRAGNSKIAVVKAHAATVIRCGVAGNFATRNLNSVAHRLHTATVIRCGVAGNFATRNLNSVAHRLHTAAVSRGVAGDLAAGHNKFAVVVHAAAVVLCGVVGDTAAGHGKFAAVVHTATNVRAIVADLAVVHGECAVVVHIHATAPFTVTVHCICGNVSTTHRKGAVRVNFNAASVARDTAAVHDERTRRGFAVFLLNVYPPVFVFIARILGNSSSALAIAKEKIAALNVDNSVTAVIFHLNAVAVQAEVEGLARRDGQGLSLFQCHIVRQVDVGDIVGVVGDVAAVPGRPGDIVARAGVVANVRVRSAADGVAMRARRFSSHAGRAQQGTQAQHYTYDPFLPRHFVTRSSSRFISLRRAEGCGVYTPGLVVMGVWGYGFPHQLGGGGRQSLRCFAPPPFTHGRLWGRMY